MWRRFSLTGVMQRCMHLLNSLTFCVHAVFLLSHSTLEYLRQCSGSLCHQHWLEQHTNSLKLLRGHCFTWSQPWRKIQENVKGLVWAVMMFRVAAPQPPPQVANFLYQRWMQPSTATQPAGKRWEETVLIGSPLHTLRAVGALCGSVEDAGTSTLKAPCIKQLGLKGKLCRGTQTSLYVLWTCFFYF